MGSPNQEVFLTWQGQAAREGVARETRTTAADGGMLEDATLGIGAAHPGTGIGTLLPEASLVVGALGTGHTLWATVGRSTHVLGQAGADGLLVVLATLRVGTAGRGLAGIYILLEDGYRRGRFEKGSRKGD